MDMMMKKGWQAILDRKEEDGEGGSLAGKKSKSGGSLAGKKRMWGSGGCGVDLWWERRLWSVSLGEEEDKSGEKGAEGLTW